LENVEEEMEKLNTELTYQKGFLQAVQKKLSNERFVENAPEAVIAIERKKEADALAKIKLIEQNLAQLQS
jgi:valyl-tRNA synthetase